MSGGFINAAQAKKNHFVASIVHDETTSIERAILQASNEGKMEIVISDTVITNSAVNSPQQLTFDVSTSTFTLNDHGFQNGDVVTFSSTTRLPSPLSLTINYFINVLDDDTFKVYTNISSEPVVLIDSGEGTLLVKKLVQSEIYFQAWKYYYLYPNANTYITIINDVEEHFKKLGYRITKIENATTFSWKLTWY